MDYGKREFAFGEVFAQPLEVGIAGRRGEVEMVVEDLEEQADCGYKRCTVTSKR